MNPNKLCRRFTICVLCVFLTPTAWAQAPAANAAPSFSHELRTQLQTIRDAALTSDYAWHQLEHLTETIGPRPGGSPAAQAAAEYVAAEMRKLGLEVHLEPAQVSHWVRGEEKAQLVEYPGRAPETTQRIVLTALSGSSATPADGITADVVVVHSFGELAALGQGPPGSRRRSRLPTKVQRALVNSRTVVDDAPPGPWQP